MAQTGREVIVVTGKLSEIGFLADKNRQINAVTQKLTAEGKEIINIVESPPESMLGFKTQQVTILWKLLDSPTQVSVAPVEQHITERISVTSDNFNSIMERIDLFLEDKEWDKATIYCESALDFDPKNADVYLKCLLAELKVSSINELSALDEPFDNSGNYKKAVRFGNEELVKINAEIANIYNSAEKRKFSMVIDSVFTITGRGPVICGKVTSGSISVNDTAFINEKACIIKGIESNRKMIDNATVGDEIGILIGGISRAEIKEGDVIIKSDNSSHSERTKINDEEKIKYFHREIAIEAPTIPEARDKAKKEMIKQYKVSEADIHFEYARLPKKSLFGKPVDAKIIAKTDKSRI